MKPRSFSFTTAHSVEHVIGLLQEHGDEAKIIAGGQSLVPTLNMRLSAPQLLIDISALDELRGISLDGDRLRIGALTRHVELQSNKLIAQHLPLIASAINHVAHVAIRNRGTIGGNLSLADPASELPACSLALGAELSIVGNKGKRIVKAGDYFKDLYETDLQANEILVAISFPLATTNTVHGFREFVRRRGDFASCGLVMNGERQDGKLTSLAPVFFAISNTPVLASKCAAKLLNKTLNDDLIEEALLELDRELPVIGDIHTSTEMKLHLAKHYLREILGEINV
ncbi:MAG: xanthine dehydrogenase family protein subunit M [Gammaproteobacteria bacterium]|nr:xanthine dehydrogenase family protein subunit M [Gammaproteobacteria bacterium]